MRTTVGLAAIALSLSGAPPAGADWLVLTDGQKSEVRAFRLLERSVDTVTLNGRSWAVLVHAIDVEATLAANGMGPGEKLSPDWPRPETSPETSPEISEEREQATPVTPLTPVVEPVERERSIPPAVPPSPAPALARRPAPIHPAAADPRTRVALFVNGTTSSTGIDLSESRSFELFSETGTLNTSYSETTRPGYEVGALVRVKGPLGVAVAAEMFEPSPAARYRALVPHPFFYERDRELEGERPDLFRRERTIHVDPVLSFELGSRVTFDVFGGVSLFYTETDVVDDILYEEVFPFETLVARGATLERIDDDPVGFNVGASGTVRVVGFFGVDFLVRYSEATARLSLSEGRELTFQAGGLRIGAGVRLLFP